METYGELRNRLNQGATSCREQVERALEAIEEGKRLNAFLSVFEERALAKADEIDSKLASGHAGRLAGMIVGVKDNIAVKDEPLTCASRILENFRSLYSATAVERLEAEDAIIVGKTNLDEFAMGSSNENSAFGNVLNPLDESRSPGGSSGGSAAAVAAGMVHVALGSETGGSVRQPAAFTGIVGAKTTYGRISRYGLTAFASSLDSIAPFARSVDDAALAAEVMAGADERDATSSRREVSDWSAESADVEMRDLKVGIPQEYLTEDLDPSIRSQIEEVRGLLSDRGISVVDISLPRTPYSIPTYYVINTAEASSNLARYDGARYGYRSPNASSVEEMYVLSRSEGFGAEVKRRIMMGTFVLSAGYYDAYYRKAQQVRRLFAQDFDAAFSEVDLILTPTTPTPAFNIGEKSADPIAMYLSDIFTAAANLTGIPALSVPFGSDNVTGMPLGLQWMAPQYCEGTMFAAGRWTESVRSER